MKATGDRYIVQRMSFAQEGASQARVFTWGEVVAFRTQRARTREEALKTSASTTHERGGKVFLLSAVDVVEVEVTGHVARELFEQGTRKGNKGPVITSFRRR